MTSPGGRAPVEIDLQARVALAHAAVDVLAEDHGVDVLHVKGPALDPSLRAAGRTSTDADVLVRPAHVPALVSALGRHGWRRVTGFRNGSVFEHAATYRHEQWGYADVHRWFPGLTLAPADAFSALWADRGSREVAHRPVPVPALLDQALLLCLHAARARLTDPRRASDVAAAWHADPARQPLVRRRAHRLGADVALAAALGELGAYDGTDRSLDLWRYFAEGGDRTDLWRARIRAAPTRRARVRLALRALAVNREFAAMMLGHEPSRRELVTLHAGRVSTAVRETASRLGGRR